jgi:holo-ACP synthase CitX
MTATCPAWSPLSGASLTDRVFAGGTPVGVTEVVQRRDERAGYQRRLCAAHPGEALVAAKLNIAGPVKSTLVIAQGFAALMARLDAALAAIVSETAPGRPVETVADWTGDAGPERFLIVAAAPADVKRAVVSVEDHEPGGRLLDLDVWFQTDSAAPARALSRTELGESPRQCLVCERGARGCARSRRHPLADLQAATARLMQDALLAEAAPYGHEVPGGHATMPGPDPSIRQQPAPASETLPR